MNKRSRIIVNYTRFENHTLFWYAPKKIFGPVSHIGPTMYHDSAYPGDRSYYPDVMTSIDYNTPSGDECYLDPNDNENDVSQLRFNLINK